ncbi:MAG: response regulator [Chitinivibrionales bacterium]
MPKILIADDEFEVLEMIKDYFEDYKEFSILTATSAKQGLGYLESETGIDMVISDINMPEMKGFEFLKIVKAKYPLVKRLLMTAFNVEEYSELALEHDAGNIFVKAVPFDFEEFEILIRKLLSEDIFGPERYFTSDYQSNEYRITSATNIHNQVKDILQSIRDNDNKLELALIEMITNAVFYGVKEETAENRANWDYDFVLEDEKSVVAKVLLDSEKYAVSITDPGGKLRKQDVLFWLNRQTKKDPSGMPYGLMDNHGRGFFLTRKYIDRLIINIDPQKKTEIIIINYYGNIYKGNKPLYINEL